MDFAFSEDQQALKQLIRQICKDHCAPDSLAKLETEDAPLHRPLWGSLAETSLLGLALPEAVGGFGLGVVELCLLLEQVGKHVAPIPAWSSLVLGALPVAEFGTEAQRQALLPPLVKGESFLSAALSEEGSQDPRSPRCRASREAGGWRLNGIKDCIPDAQLASHILVSAATEAQQVVLFLVDPKAEGARLEEQRGTDERRLGRLLLEDLRLEDEALLGSPEQGGAILNWLLPRAQVGLCALALGVAERALHMTASYTAERHQFGRPIATFQAVSQRAGDAYIDVETMRLALWRAAWLLDAGQPAERAVAVARIMAADGGHRVANAAQHLHGGIGFDRDYPLYRYFLWAKQIEFTLGAAPHHIARLGAMLADEIRSKEQT